VRFRSAGGELWLTADTNYLKYPKTGTRMKASSMQHCA
jgi:hypothetical protein